MTQSKARKTLKSIKYQRLIRVKENAPTREDAKYTLRTRKNGKRESDSQTHTRNLT